VVVTTCVAISAAIAVAGGDGAMSTTVNACRAFDGREHVAGDGGVDVLGALAVLGASSRRKPSLCV
jgi:hypothetical protein